VALDEGALFSRISPMRVTHLDETIGWPELISRKNSPIFLSAEIAI